MAFITITGQNQIAKKQGDGEALNIAMFVLANVPNLGSEPATRIESIPNTYVVDQLAVTKSGYVNTNQVVYSLVMGSNVGDYSFNWVGLVDDEGVLIAVTYIPLTQKTKNDGGVPGNTFTRNFLLAYTGIQQTTAITVPAETWQIDFSARLSGIDERERLSNLDIYGHESFIDEGWKVTGSAGTYNVAAGIGYVGGVRAKNSAPQEITTAVFPNEIWLNVSLQGDISDMTAVAEFVIDTGPFVDYVDGNGVEHYLTKIVTIASDGTVTDARKIYETLQMHKSDEDPHHQYKEYADTKSTEALNAAKSDASTKANNALSTAKIYADSKGSSALNSAKSYTDEKLEESGVPVSAVIFTASITAPTGYLKANGAAVSRTSYAALYSKIGTTFGAGNGSTTFNIPDLRGEFIRGFDDGRGVDVDRVFGSWQEDAIRNITGSMSGQNRGNFDSGDGAFSKGANNGRAQNDSGNYFAGSFTFDASRVVPTADDNRPRNIALTACIKY